MHSYYSSFPSILDKWQKWGECPEYRIDTRLWLDFIKFFLECASDISQFLRRVYCEKWFLPSNVPQQARFLQTHLVRVVHTDALYFNVEHDDTGGMQFTVFPVICPAHAVRALPKRRHLGPLKYKGSRKKRRDDGRGPDQMASCNSKLFQWNGIERPVDLLVAQHPTRSSFCSASRARKRKREWEGEGRGKELRKATLLHRLLDWFSLCSKILTTSLSSVDCIFTASNKGSGL